MKTYTILLRDLYTWVKTDTKKAILEIIALTAIFTVLITTVLFLSLL